MGFIHYLQKINIFLIIFLVNIQLVFAKTVSVRLDGHPIYIFNGLPKIEGWGEDLVYPATPSSVDKRTMGALGGLPVVDIWNKHGGIAVFNTQVYQEPFTVQLLYDEKGVTIKASGATQIEVYPHQGDYYQPVRAFALKMQSKGLAVKPAPDWAFNANWETYGFEEDYDLNTIRQLLPELKNLGIKTITLDAGWYGHSRGDDYQFNTGDFSVNPDIIGTEQDLANFIDELHQQRFRVRLWWTPGVAESSSQLRKVYPDWFAEHVISSTGDTDDIFLNPDLHQVKAWHKALVNRLISYGVDGFKQDDVYHYRSSSAQAHIDYANLINANLTFAQSIKKDFAINTCNCGLAQNFYLLAGQNQIITSDPVGSRQFRHRAKYLHALNVNGAAILADHIELTRGDIDPETMDEKGFYDSVDFSSVVPLGMVLQTKFRHPPGAHYQRWFKIFSDYQFYKMRWINIPLLPDKPEAYLLKNNTELFFSFFADRKNRQFTGAVQLTNLSPGIKYDVIDFVNHSTLGSFVAKTELYNWHTTFNHHIHLLVKPAIDNQ